MSDIDGGIRFTSVVIFISVGSSVRRSLFSMKAFLSLILQQVSSLKQKACDCFYTVIFIISILIAIRKNPTNKIEIIRMKIKKVYVAIVLSSV